MSMAKRMSEYPHRGMEVSRDLRSFQFHPAPPFQPDCSEDSAILAWTFPPDQDLYVKQN